MGELGRFNYGKSIQEGAGFIMFDGVDCIEVLFYERGA